MNCPTPIERVSNRLLNITEQIVLFKDCKWAPDCRHVVVQLTGNNRFSKPLNRERFNVLFGGYTFMLDRNNERLTRKAWDAFKSLQSELRERGAK